MSKLILILMLLLVVGIAEAKVLAEGSGVIGNIPEVSGEVSISFEEPVKANPLIGIIIIGVINVVGLGVYFIKVLL